MTRPTVSGRADPRTSPLVFLFKEFVPLEYHQQLSMGVQNKRTLASFSTWKVEPMEASYYTQWTSLHRRALAHHGAWR